MKEKFQISPIVILITLFLILVFCFPIHFMADDFEHLFYAAIGRPTGEGEFFLYRTPFLYFFTKYVFPFFYQTTFNLANLITFGSLLLTSLTFYLTFFNYQSNSNQDSFFIALVLFLFIFFPNNHEWIFWPINMASLPMMIFAALAFYYESKFPTALAQFFKIIATVLVYLTFESYLFMMFLFELYFVLYRNYSWKKAFINYFVLALFILVFKIWASQGNTYHYTSKLAFKFHLFEQMLGMFFNLDFYKVRWFPGAFYLFGLCLIAFLRYKLIGLKDFLRKDILMIVGILFSTSYYFIIMDYSARRALEGQLFFFAFWIAGATFWVYFHPQILKPFKIITLCLILIPLYSHLFFIGWEKHLERERQRSVAISLIEQVSQEKRIVDVDLSLYQKDMRRGFGFTLPKQAYGFNWYMLPRDIFNCIKVNDLEEDRFPFYLDEKLKNQKCKWQN